MIKGKVDSKALERKLSTATKGTVEGINRETKMAARLYCGVMAKYTQPFGSADSEGAKDRFSKVVDAQVRRTQKPMDQLGSIWVHLKSIDKGLSAAFWSYVKAGKMGQARKVLDDLAASGGISVGGVDYDAHKKARTGKKRGVPGKFKPATIINSLSTKDPLKALIAKKQKVIGAAKAGWAKAAKSIGGTVSKREQFARWFNTGAHRQSQGTHSISKTATGILFRITNKVAWASGALDRSGISQANAEYPKLWKQTMEGETKRKAAAALKRQLKKQNG